MPVDSKSIKYFPQKHGRGRFHSIYIFGDREVRFRGFADSQTHADQLLIDMEPKALRRFVNEDADKAVRLGLPSHGEAGEIDVEKLRLNAGLFQRESYLAYNDFKGVLPFTGTNRQEAQKYGMEEDEIQEIRERWDNTLFPNRRKYEDYDGAREKR